MSANIPFEIQVEIMKRAPVKSLIRFRSVSKQWKSVIDSSDFINDHSVKEHHLLVWYRILDTEPNFLMVVDDDTFPHRKHSPVVSLSVNLSKACIVSSSHGLVCLYGVCKDLNKDMFVVWNPSIRKSVAIGLPVSFNVVGFGVCPKTRDPKFVKVEGPVDNMVAVVFSLSSGVWRSVPINHVPYESIRSVSGQETVDGVIYWVVAVKIKNNESTTSVRLLSFDLTNEEFRDRAIQDNLAREVQFPFGSRHPDLRLSKLNETLVVLNYHTGHDVKRVCNVWMMLKTGVPDPLFTKLFTVNINNGLTFYDITGFRKTGQPLMDQRHRRKVTELEVYDPSSEHINGLGIFGCIFKTTSYTESLLLHNHTGPIIM